MNTYSRFGNKNSGEIVSLFEVLMVFSLVEMIGYRALPVRKYYEQREVLYMFFCYEIFNLFSIIYGELSKYAKGDVTSTEIMQNPR